MNPKKLALSNTDMMALAESGKSHDEIAGLVGVNRSTVCRRLQHLTPRKSTEIYKQYRSDIFAEMQRKLMSSCTGADLKKLSARDKIVAMGILYDKEQLERGISDPGARPMVVINIRGNASVNVDNPVDNTTCQPLGKAIDV